MTITTPIPAVFAYYTQAITDKRYADAAAAMTEALANLPTGAGSANAATIATYTANRNAAVTLSRAAGAY